MRYTNKLNLPEVFNKVIKDKEPVKNRYSVTELLKSTKEIKLTRLHWNQLETDISDSITALFGSAVHKVFEENSDSENSEIKLELQIGEDTLVGIIDHISEDTIEDYKTTSVSKVSKKDFKEHELQIKIYAWMRFQFDGIITRKGKLYYLMKDWSKIKAASGGNYPSSAIYVHEFDIQDSDYDYAEEYVMQKISLIKSSYIIDCTEEERWYTGTQYAVYKNASDKKASYVTDSEEDAHSYITNKCNGAGEIQVRKGEYLKCKYYCNCNKFCDQWRKEED